MSNVPDDRKYSKEDDWVKVEDGKLRIGITDYAQENLGEIVNVELIKEVGDTVEVGEEIAYLESIKATADIKANMNGKVVAVNDTLLDDNMEYKGKFNESPYEEWLYIIEPVGECEGLISADEYNKLRS